MVNEQTIHERDPSTTSEASDRIVRRLEQESLETLIDALKERGYTILGPTIRESSIVYDEISGLKDLPRGWSDDQSNGRYRIRNSGGQGYFDFAVGPTSAKRFLFPPRLELFRTQRGAKEISVGDHALPTAKYAFFGIRPCDVQAIARQDEIFMNGAYEDPDYRSLRETSLLITVNCTNPAGTCFCASMGTGPKAQTGFDLAITEVIGEDSFYLVEEGSPKGTSILEVLPSREASADDIARAEESMARASQSMGRKLETEGLKELLAASVSDHHWENIGGRCLTCANCTLVCPTCFCATVEDATDLTGSEAIRTRRWDSCFHLDFSYIHGGSVRTSSGARYRQWMTHKLSCWVDQFGEFGCVGCGRCITWCPVGIDITEEAGVLRRRAEASQ